jgi:hypothetical protein
MRKSLLYSALAGLCFLASQPALAEDPAAITGQTAAAEAGDTPIVKVEPVGPDVELVSEPPSFLEEAKRLGFGKVIEHDGRHYYELEAKTQQGVAYPTYYAVRENKLAARVIILPEALAEPPACHPDAETCVKLRLTEGEAEMAFNLQGASQSYAYVGAGVRESGYFSQVEGAPAVRVGELAADLNAVGLSQLSAWGPLPESRMGDLATTDFSPLGLALGQNGIKLNNKLGVSPSLLQPTNGGLILKSAQKWKFGKVRAALTPLNTYLDFDAAGNLVKASWVGHTQASQAAADKTCLALDGVLGKPAAAMVQKAGAGAHAVEIHSWWWLDHTRASLLRCTTVDSSRMGAPEKTLVGYTLSNPAGNFGPVLTPVAAKHVTSEPVFNSAPDSGKVDLP